MPLHLERLSWRLQVPPNINVIHAAPNRRGSSSSAIRICVLLSAAVQRQGVPSGTLRRARSEKDAARCLRMLTKCMVQFP